MTATYATISDVKRIMALNFNFDTSTNPTKDQLTAAIEDAQDEIDQQTQHAWREISVVNEFYDFPYGQLNQYNPYGDHSTGIEIHIRHRLVKTFDTSQGDKIEIWTGDAYEDWVTAKTEGRESDYWLETEQGILHLRYFHPFFRRKSLRLTYRYGESIVPTDIRKVTASMAAMELIQNDDRSANMNETGDATRLDFNSRLNVMRRKVDKILKNRTEFSVI